MGKQAYFQYLDAVKSNLADNLDQVEQFNLKVSVNLYNFCLVVELSESCNFHYCGYSAHAVQQPFLCTSDLKRCYSKCGRIKRKFMLKKYIDKNDFIAGFQSRQH